MRIISYILAPSIIIILAGCSSYDFESIERGVIEYNQKVGTALTNYEDTLTVAKPVEESIKNVLVFKESFSIQELEFLNMSSDKYSTLSQGLQAFQREINSYVDTINNMETASFQTGLASEKLDISEIVETSITTHYFLDDTDGKVEQMFLLQLPNGYTSSISIYWYGGVIIDVEAYNL